MNPKVELLNRARKLPIELLEDIQNWITKDHLYHTIEFLENDLIFWRHEMELTPEWIAGRITVLYIPWPHPHREMNLPLYSNPILDDNDWETVAPIQIE